MKQQDEIIEYLNKNGDPITFKTATTMGISSRDCATCIPAVLTPDPL